MPIEDNDAPRLAEIGRRITEVGQNLSDFRNEVRGNFNELVRKETYAVERDAMKERISNAEKGIANLEQRAKAMQNLVYGGLVSIIVAVIVMWLTRGGG